uniref:Uncharacterized protein n=1 Tax=Anguilla anguilla TaxID=7936 RepID=A0A0E9QRP8_ANGAN
MVTVVRNQVLTRSVPGHQIFALCPSYLSFVHVRFRLVEVCRCISTPWNCAAHH